MILFFIESGSVLKACAYIPMPSSRMLLLIGTVIAVALTIILLRPWETTVGYRIDYLRSRAAEIAECIESGEAFRLTDDWVTENVSVALTIKRPCEELIVMMLNYTRVLALSPVNIDEVVRGRPEDRFSRLRSVAVYINGTHLIVDPKPILEYVKVVEYNRTVHVIKLTIFNILGELRKDSTLAFNNTINIVQYRFYDYSGASEVIVSEQNALSFTVEENDCLKIVVAIEEWVSG